MNNSREELIDMVELASPAKKHTSRLKPIKKKKNKILSPPFVSPVRSVDKDVTSLFSVKRASSKLSSSLDDDTETVSDNMSDDVLSDRSPRNVERSGEVGFSAKSKRKQSHKVNKIKLSLEKLRRESSEIEANIKSVRSRFSLEGRRTEKPEFTFFGSANEKLEEIDEEPKNIGANIQYVLPEKLRINLDNAEKECFFIPTSQPLPLGSKLTDDDPRPLEEEGLFMDYNLQVPKRHINIVERRLFSVDDKKWFNCEGNMAVLPTPVIDRCVRPNLDTRAGDCAIYTPPQTHVDFEEVHVVKEKLLELSLSHLKFSHHPLFSLEHVLEEKLNGAYRKYSTSVENNTLQKLKNQLEALKHAKKLKKDDGKDGTLKEIRKLRESLFREGKMQRDSLKTALDSWKGIKKLRQEQKYSNTNVRLVIKKDRVNLTEEKEAYEKFFAETLGDILDEHKNVFKRKLKEYNRKISAKQEAINDVKTDSDEADDSDMEKPVYDVDEKNLESQLRGKFEESFKPPGEPKLTLILKHDNEITKNVDDEKENARRKVVSTTKFTLKILCNGIHVCKSKPVNLNDSFVLDLDDSFSIQLMDVPKFMTLSLSEHPKGLLKKKLCELNIEVPDDSVTYSRSKPTEVDFEKKEIVHYKHAGVGSGCNFKTMMEESGLSLNIRMGTVETNTAGCLSLRIGWHKSSTLNINGSRTTTNWHESQIPSVLDKWGAVDEKQLDIWLEGRRPDPQDPRNSAIFEYLELKGVEGVQRWKQRDNVYFRLSPYAEKTFLCKIEELNQNIRLQYLKLRDQNEIEFDGMLVPNRIREIPFALLKDYKKRKAMEALRDNDDFADDLETSRDTGSRHLKQIQTKIFQTCKGLNNNLSYESVVDEKYLIYFEDVIKTSLKNLLNWFRWQPKLSKPLPRMTKKNETIETEPNAHVHDTQNKIIIKILSGKNIPKIKSPLKKADGDSPRMLDREVRPFLEITYEDFFTKTSVLAGSDPLWNKLVELPIKYHHADYLNPNALIGSIAIDLFDHIKSDEEHDDETDNKFWLGEIKIPLSALTTGLNLNGWFRVKTPPFLLGYETNDDQMVPKSPKLTNIQNATTNETYIELNLHISPSIPVLEPNMADLPSNEIPYIKDHVTKWSEIFNSSFPSKKFNVFALDTKGRTNCITRYIRPLEPPQLNTEEFDVTPDQCLRYVSLIPFTDCNPFYQNLWLKTDELLKFMVGSVIDHCIALTCFLLALKTEAYLVLGYGIPNGFTAYVLLLQYGRESEMPTYLIMDVSHNKTFNVTDAFCPLQKIYCVVNGENVWGNAQRTQNPAVLRFDFSRKSDWWPLFNDDVSAPTNFVNNKIHFAATGDSLHVERQLERKLKRKIFKWRPMDRTTFNRRVSEAFKNALRFFEMNAMYGRSNTEAMIELNKKNSQYIVNGIVVNLPFTNISAIVKKIKRFNLHVQSSDMAEFALSVLIQSYPGQVLSVWIFFGTVVNKFSL